MEPAANAGVRRFRWFMRCDGRAVIRFRADRTPLGLDDRFYADMAAAIAAAGRQDVQIMFVLLDVLCAERRDVSGVQLGGRDDMLREEAKRAALLDGVLRPIFERYGDSPHIFAWDVFNEPE